MQYTCRACTHAATATSREAWRVLVVVMWLAVPDMVVQGFAALVMVLVVAGVAAVVALGSRGRRARVPARRPARLPSATSGLAVRLDRADRNGTERVRR
jgi:hypothetical protein